MFLLAKPLSIFALFYRDIRRRDILETGKLPLAPEWHATNFCSFFELRVAALQALSASSSRIPRRDPHPPTRWDMPQGRRVLFPSPWAVLSHLFQNQAL